MLTATLFIQHDSPEHSLCAKPCAGCQGNTTGMQRPCSQGPHDLVGPERGKLLCSAPFREDGPGGKQDVGRQGGGQGEMHPEVALGEEPSE